MTMSLTSGENSLTFVYIRMNFGPYTCIHVAQWVARLTRNDEGVGSSPIIGPCCFIEQETFPLLLSTGWFQERVRA